MAAEYLKGMGYMSISLKRASLLAWFILFFSGTSSLLSQDVTGEAGKGTAVLAGSGSRQGQWQRFGVADGLPPASVGALLQDRQGRLWLGTGRFLEGLEFGRAEEEGAGVVCYDGAQFVTYTTADGLADNTVLSIAEDQEGNLWFGTARGVSRYDGQSFTTFTLGDSWADNVVLSIIRDRGENLWFGTAKGANRYDGQQFEHFTLQDNLFGNVAVCMLEDHQGNLWFGTAQGASRYDGQEFRTFTVADGLPDNTVLSIAQDKEGTLWFGTAKGLSRYDGQGFLTLPVEDGLIWSFAEDTQGDLWVATEKGARRYDGQAWTTYTVADGLKSDALRSVIKGREGELWFGALGGGLSKYDDQHLRTFTTRDGLMGNKLMAIVEDRRGDLWFGGWDKKGLSRYDGKTWTTFTAQDGLVGNWAVPFLEDREGNLWVSAAEKLGLYDGKQFETFTIQDGLADNWVQSIWEDRQGNLWFGTDKGGVSRYNGKQFKTFTTQDGLADNWVQSIWEDRQGNLWFGTEGEGVSRYDGKQFKTFNTADGLAGNQVHAIREDQHGYLWFGTWGGGVSRYDGKQFKTFTTTDGLSHNRVLAILEDRRGQLWFGTWGGGVTRYDGRVFQRLLAEDGLAHDVVQGLTQTRNGDIWIATEGGATRYRPAQTPPAIRLTNVTAGRPYGPVIQLRLPSSQDYLLLEFQGASLQTLPQRMMYVYKLEGHDPDWRVTRENRVEYTDLPVGTYTFQVKAVDRDLNYSETSATVAVEVFYQAIVSPVRLAEVHLQDLFASFYKTYTTQPLGSVQVVNDSPDSVAATLSFFLPDYMRRPSEQPLSLAPNTSQQVEVKALLDGQVLNLKESVPVQAEVSLAVASGEQSIAVKAKQEVILHARGALTWEGVGKAAAFITPDDPAVSEFARSTLVAFEEQIKSLGKPYRNLLRAMVLFEALKQHGVRYVPDANRPYAKVRAEASAIDHISYPAEVLQGKAGDCDDLTVLFCALLENAGVSTALVDAPGHIFLLFDSGVSRQEVYKLPVEEKLYVVRGDRVWVPVEVTLVGEGFARAWQAGAEEMIKVRAERERVVDTQAAWEVYAPANPVFVETGSVPSREETQEGVRGQYAALEKQIDDYIEQTYLYPLKTHPDDAALWSELARVYVGLGRYDAAIKLAYRRLTEKGGEDATTFNQLGIAHYLKGDLEQAGYFFKKAVELAPDDKKMRGNLEKALGALGKGERLKGKPPAAVAGSEELDTEEVGTKAGQVEVDEDSFYWGEE